MSVRNCFVRGSVVRYVHVRARAARRPPAPRRLAPAARRRRAAAPHPTPTRAPLHPTPPPPPTPRAQLPPGSVDVEILHDATRREAKGG